MGLHQSLQVVEVTCHSMRSRFVLLELFTQEESFFQESPGGTDSADCLDEVGIHIFILEGLFYK